METNFEKLYLNVLLDTYSESSVVENNETLTVGELMEMLQNAINNEVICDDTKIVIKSYMDNVYGTLCSDDLYVGKCSDDSKSLNDFI